MVLLHVNPLTGYQNVIMFKGDIPAIVLRTHSPDQCEGRPCDIHRPTPGVVLNWRDDQGFMEFICEHGVGHPTRAQRAYWQRVTPSTAEALAIHGCCGCCGDFEPNDKEEKEETE